MIGHSRMGIVAAATAMLAFAQQEPQRVSKQRYRVVPKKKIRIADRSKKQHLIKGVRP